MQQLVIMVIMAIVLPICVLLVLQHAKLVPLKQVVKVVKAFMELLTIMMEVLAQFCVLQDNMVELVISLVNLVLMAALHVLEQLPLNAITAQLLFLLPTSSNMALLHALKHVLMANTATQQVINVFSVVQVA